MKQSRRMSMVEATTNIAIGFVVSVAITGPVLALFGFQTTIRHDVAITAIFTITSLARSYLVRRAFNRIHR